jgi:elongation factor G
MAKPQHDTRNIAILAHVDAGKTTVSERLLYFSDTIAGLGEVDEGLATMDYLEEEKKRGITIEAGIASYTWKGTRVTFVDTPGHVDFGVEVDFALRAVEGVVLVLSGVSGIESQSLEAWEKIRENKNAPLLFINKLDQDTSNWHRVLSQVQVLFGVKPLVLTFPIYDGDKIDGVVDVVHELALYRSVEHPRKLIKGSIPERHREDYERYRKELIDITSQFSDAVMNGFLSGEEISSEALLGGVRAALASGAFVPVLMGAALKNVGLRQLMNAINQLLPPPQVPADADSALGLVIKVRFYPSIGRIYLAKLFSPDALRKLAGAKFYRVFAESLEPLHEAQAGDIVAIQTDRRFVVGQLLGKEGRSEATSHKGYRPLLQSRLEPMHAEDWGKLDAVLKQMADAEPSIAIGPDHATGGWLLRTVGELQLDVFTRRLKQEHGCDVRVGLPQVRYEERLKAPLADIEGSAKAFGASLSIKLKAQILAEGEGNRLDIAVENLPDTYREIFESAFESFCMRGVCGYGAVHRLGLTLTSLTGDMTPLPPPLLAKCLTDTLEIHLICEKFEVFEPIMRLEIIVPDEFCGAVLEDLASRGGAIRKMDSDGSNSVILLEIPLANTFGYTTLLRSLSRGLGVFVLTYEKHGPRRKA